MTKHYPAIPKLKTLFWMGSFSLCCLVLQWSALRSLTSGHKSQSAQVQQLVRQVKASELLALSKMPAVGFGNLLADWAFLDFLQYFGDDDVRATEGYELSASYFEPIIAHDPHYRQFYLFLSGSSSIYAATPTTSVSLMEKGLTQLSPNEPADSYYVWRYKGVDELLFLGDGRAAQRSFETAARWAEASSDPAGGMFAELSSQTAHYLSANPNSAAAQVNAWSSVLTTAIDDATRERAVAQIEALGGSVVFSEDGGIRIEFAQKDGQDSES